MQKYLNVFETLKSERVSEFMSKHGLEIKTGYGLDAAILKLLKPTWTTDGPQQILNSNGLFFGVWIDANCEAKAIVRYNVHAKKLRAIKGETFAAREFARTFRAQAKDELASWPNCSYPKGPITLFEGHFPLDQERLHSETSQIMDRFAKLTPKLQQMLDASH